MSEETTKADNSRTIKMNDGREVRFGEKTRMKKEYGVSDQGLIFCRIDFDNGESIEVLVDPNSEVGRQALGHGLSQKLGDAAAGAESTEDAFEAVIEVAKQISAGKWNKAREGGGSAKGASDLVIALAEVLGKEKETVRNLLANMSAAEKAMLRKVPDVLAAIERIKAARGPAKVNAEKAAQAAALFDALKA